MIVTFARGAFKASATLEVSRLSWTLEAARRVGELEVYVPRTCPLWDGAILVKEGGFLVEAHDGRLGTWRGVAYAPDFQKRRAGVVVRAAQLPIIATLRVVSRNRNFRSMTPGAIARAAAIDALEGYAGGLLVGPFAEGGPLITSYQFRGQTLAEVLNDLAGRSGQEWWIDDNSVLTWGGSRGRYVTDVEVLLEGGSVFDTACQPNTEDVVAEVIGRSQDGREFVAVAGENIGGLWQRQVVVNVAAQGGARLGQETIQTLNARRFPQATYRFQLDERWWGRVREGDYVRLVLPHIGVSGETVLVRVTDREWRTGASTLGCTGTRIPPWTVGTPINFGNERIEPGPYISYLHDAVRRVGDAGQFAFLGGAPGATSTR